MKNFTKKQFREYKDFFNDDARIKDLTFEEFQKYLEEVEINWNILTEVEEINRPVSTSDKISSCDRNIGYFVYDVICLALEVPHLRSTVRTSTVDKMAKSAAPAKSYLKRMVKLITEVGATVLEMAKCVFNSLKALFDKGVLKQVIKDFLSGLSWKDYVIYGAIAVVSIIAIVASDGAVFMAFLVIALLTFKNLLSDCIRAKQTCNIS